MFGSAVAGLTAVLVATVDPAQLFAPSYLGMLLVFGGLLVLRFVRVPFRARAVGFVLVLLLVATLALLNFGVAPAPLLALALATIVAGTFLGRGALAVTAIAAPLAILVSGWVSTRGWVRPSNPTFAPTEWLDWVRAAFEYALAGGSVAALLLLIIYQLERHEIARARAERLEALGRLAGGVAHDFNNSLQVMFVWQELLASHDDETVREAMEEIGVAAEQASRLTAQLLAFGKRDLWAPVPLALGDEVERWAVAIRRVLPEDVRLEVSTEANPVVVCDPGQLEQILLNLVVNARDALGGAGRIEVSLETVDASELPDASVGGRAHAAYAVMRVRDDGPGMSEEVRKRVFEPFFSTKEQLGTGLGLSIVHSAVQRAGGWTDVETELERGTTFSVYFPCEDGASVPLPAERRDEPLPAVEPGGVVLLAEDEAPIRRNLSTFLRAEGYRVLEAEDGDRAMTLLELHASEVDVLCTDGVMPGISTASLIARFRELRPEGRVIVSSGHIDEELVRRQLTTAQLELLRKPFTPSQLLARLRR